MCGLERRHGGRPDPSQKLTDIDHGWEALHLRSPGNRSRIIFNGDQFLERRFD